jgi:hypothetical protein
MHSHRAKPSFRVADRSRIALRASPTRVVRSVRRRSYGFGMTLGIVVFGAAFLVGLALGASTKRPLTTTGLVVGGFTAVLVAQTHEPFVAFAVFSLLALTGLVADSVRETVALLLDR